MAPMVEREDSVAEFEQLLSLSADVAHYNVDELADSVTRLKEAGVDVRDGRAMLKNFVRAGVPQGDMESLALITVQVAAATDRSPRVASQQTAEAFYGGDDALRDLDRQINFLTAEQLREVRRFQSEGKFDAAKNYAREILTAKLAAISFP